MTITLDGSTGISTDTGFSCDGISFANNAPSNSLVVNSSGNVGIGTSSPDYKLDVDGAIGISTATNNYLTFHNGSGSTYAGIKANANSNLIFATGSDLVNSERMRIDSSGNVGIGTSSPLSGYSLTTQTPLYVNNQATDITPTAGGWAGQLTIKANGYSGGLSMDSTGLWVGHNSGSRAVVFAVNATEKMRIDSSGNLLVGTTDVSVNGLALSPSTNGRTVLNTRTTTTSSSGLVFFYNPNGSVGAISTSGTSTSYATSSDYRLKENIQPMQNALATVAQLNPVTYTWKADGSDGKGFIAHELQAIVPDCVTGEKDAVDEEGNPVYQGIDTSFLVATLTKAIQELSAKNDALEARLTALEAK